MTAPTNDAPRGLGGATAQRNSDWERESYHAGDAAPVDRGPRRRFLIIAFSLGLLRPQRLVDEVARDLRQEATS